MSEQELDTSAYVGVDPMYQNAANHTEHPLLTDHERARVEAARAEMEYEEPVEDDEEYDEYDDDDDDEEDDDDPEEPVEPVSPSVVLVPPPVL